MRTLTQAAISLRGEAEGYLALRSRLSAECPLMMKALRVVDTERAAPGRGRGYNLYKRENRKLGFVWYVRYRYEGTMLSSKWCAHTNNRGEAERFAEENRERLVREYLKRRAAPAYRFFRNYYDESTALYRSEAMRNGEVGVEQRKRARAIIANKFIPFLKERGVTDYEKITTALLDDFQGKLLADGLLPQTVNANLCSIGKSFKYLVRKGIIRDNPFNNLEPVPGRRELKKSHGCYETSRLKGVFEKRWGDKFSRLLNMIVYGTDMRNGEIKSFSLKDIIEAGGIHFIDLKRSKTEAGVRLVPLHEKVYRGIREYAKGTGEAEAIFGNVSCYRFKKAYRDLAVKLGVSKETLVKENITYYSGRHYWKTLMSAEGLGEGIEEVFMGHRVTNDVAKLYNHREAAGMKRTIKAAKEVFRILDRCLFR